MAKIVVNGKNEELEKSVSLSELLKLKNIRPEVVTIELNDSIVERKDYAVTIVKDGDRLELVYFMGGGENG
ncbi:MAG: thiamine biosynthesis protein ThiS [Candidatus Omnitrophica bacterium CG11_big_fil_rev_8_21_14_0_20_42_13]|uniref:Thiamine biosynthesis protein ThiS n=1 Tax=Candidatus Ghiorseimicrobium undicola TaxID=1974746 RepID=A0A2H0LV93_9BACT|nr:MAG: thiamine biosynthesis protein ThiS [Candidatus Omnitrophica bacterium CG11_big_fil_rev_8_21_14_0_20_42_13]